MSEVASSTRQPVMAPSRVTAGEIRAENAGTWSVDPYDEPAWTQGHWHSEPACAWPDCATYLTRSQMAALHVEGGGRR